MKDKTKKTEVDTSPRWWVMITIFVTVLVAWLFSWWAVSILHTSAEVRGQFGDMFGAVNALFSGLAFGGVIYAIFLQQKELSLQRNELELTREELGRTAEAQELQSEASRGLLELERDRRALDMFERKKKLDLDLEIYEIRDNNQDRGLSMIVDNKGAPVFNLRIATSESVTLVTQERDKVWYPGPGRLAFIHSPPEGTQREVLKHFGFVVTYDNKLGMRRSKAFNTLVNPSAPRHWIREIETVDGDHPNLIKEIGQHISSVERIQDA